MYYVLKAFMKQKGITQKELAEHLGITKQCLSNKMNLQTRFTLEECLAIKEYMNYEDCVEHLFKKIKGA